MMKTQGIVVLGGAMALLAATGCHEVMWAVNGQAGVTAYQQGRLAEAERHFNQALGMMRSLQPQQPYILNELALIYETQNKYKQAEELYLRSLQLLEKYRGPEDPEVATTLHHLAELYEVQGDYGKAEPSYQKALALREKALGPDHLYVAYLLEDYSSLLKKTGRQTEANELQVRVKAIRDRQTVTPRAAQ
jgi:tetratricopeptide (TPR) repeat protein